MSLMYSLRHILESLPAGHVLISPRRVTPRFANLTAEEVADLWYVLEISCLYCLSSLRITV